LIKLVNKKFDKKDLYLIKEEDAKLPGLSEGLSRASVATIRPILIKVARDRSAGKQPQEILKEYESKNDFFGVSSINQRTIFEFGLLFYSILPHTFDAVELSPITPLGLNSVLTKISQDLSLSTMRLSEVVSDPTTPLILECATRRRKLLREETTKYTSVELATMKRVLRLQPFDKDKGYMQHFNLLGLCSAGYDLGSAVSITTEFVKNHISIWLDFIEKLKSKGFVFNEVTVKLSDTAFLEHLIKNFSIPREIICKNAFNEKFDFLSEYKLPLPREVDSISEIDHNPNKSRNIGQHYLLDLLAIEKNILNPLKIEYPQVHFRFDFARKAGLGYYDGVCFHIYGSTINGETIQIADGGSVDWLAKVMSNSKERAVTSGFGAELIQKRFNIEEE